MHQNPGKSTNCKRTFPIAPESASFRNRNQGSERNPPETVAMPAQSFAILGIVVELQIPGDPIAILFQATPMATGLQSTQNLPYFATHLSSSSRIDPKNDSNQHNQTGSQLNCRSTKDCNVIGRIALKLYGFHTNPAVHAQSDKSRQNKRPRGRQEQERGSNNPHSPSIPPASSHIEMQTAIPNPHAIYSQCKNRRPASYRTRSTGRAARSPIATRFIIPTRSSCNPIAMRERTARHI